jgi:small subunit ribosomal protein S5
MTEKNKTAPEAEIAIIDESVVSAPEATADGRGQRERRPRRGGAGRDRKPREAKEFEEAILQIDRVTRVVKGGRRLRFRLTVVIGDKKGRVGFGIGKSAEVMTAIQKAVVQAKRNLITVPMDNGTLPHEANESFKASRVLLFPAPEGKGIIAGGAVRKILELAGVKDVLSKSHGSRNKLNVAVATFNALQSLATAKNPGAKITKADLEMKDDAEEKTEAPVAHKKTVEASASPVKKPAAKKPAASAKTTADKKKSDSDKK